MKGKPLLQLIYLKCIPPEHTNYIYTSKLRANRYLVPSPPFQSICPFYEGVGIFFCKPWEALYHVKKTWTVYSYDRLSVVLVSSKRKGSFKVSTVDATKCDTFCLCINKTQVFFNGGKICKRQALKWTRDRRTVDSPLQLTRGWPHSANLITPSYQSTNSSNRCMQSGLQISMHEILNLFHVFL